MKFSISTRRGDKKYKWIIDTDETKLNEIFYCLNEQYPIEEDTQK